ncbi:hypothetical protein ACLB2K_017198 [Fragaria x ananassa]
MDVIGNVTEKAVGNEGFAVVEQRGGVESVYGLAQCWRTIGEKGCRDCLEVAGKNLRGCLPVKGHAAGLWEVLAVMVAGMVLYVLSLFGFTMAYQRLQKKTVMTSAPVVTSKSQHKNRLNFKYEMLGKDTDFFNALRKLGQGGAGSVFKGTIPDGSNIAVKRLFFNTRQWVQHNTRQYSSDSLASFQTNIKPMKPPHSL